MSPSDQIRCAACGTLNPGNRLFCTSCHLNLRKSPAQRPVRHRLIIPQEAPRRAVMRRYLPPHVRAALRAIGVEGSAGFQTVRKTYRRLMKQYHPDTARHGNTEFRVAAESKTKELNAAYRVLEEFYSE